MAVSLQIKDIDKKSLKTLLPINLHRYLITSLPYHKFCLSFKSENRISLAKLFGKRARKKIKRSKFQIIQIPLHDVLRCFIFYCTLFEWSSNRATIRNTIKSVSSKVALDLN
ncbi:hypothetical protein WUBG_08412 [Wuchereria bancrofti]|uniref:Uncharacterized protein n=1 Tax=Wuchereria bancrofti TaxID=6293 RepID=J9EET1_WUCBA|nr:hypothetical protein WUBG_08412 [Wuchereria bancrofti]